MLAFKFLFRPMIRSFAVSMLMSFMFVTAFAQTPAAAPAAAPATPAGDAAKGRELTRMCEGCHGIDGWRTAYPEVYRVPKLGGQHAAYIVQALHEYRNAERSHPSMQAIAGSLSDQDMANLAAYYSQAGGNANTASK